MKNCGFFVWFASNNSRVDSIQNNNNDEQTTNRRTQLKTNTEEKKKEKRTKDKDS